MAWLAQIWGVLFPPESYGCLSLLPPLIAIALAKVFSAGWVENKIVPFAAGLIVGSLIANGTPEEIINADRKEFTEQGLNVSISQVEERDLLGFAARREELEQSLEELHTSRNYDLTVLAVTDVALHLSMILAIGDEKILAKLPFERKDSTLLHAPGVVSRKRQIFPAVCEAIQHSR